MNIKLTKKQKEEMKVLKMKGWSYDKLTKNIKFARGQ